jgi:acyl-CoA hydrolase
MAWVDVVGGIVAYKHSESVCTTAAVDYFSFDRPIHVRDVIVIEGRMTYVGSTSMEVRVDTFIERPGEEPVRAGRARMIYVAVDGNGTPVKVPPLVPETDEEREEFKEGARRAEARKARREK